MPSVYSLDHDDGMMYVPRMREAMSRGRSLSHDGSTVIAREHILPNGTFLETITYVLNSRPLGSFVIGAWKGGKSRPGLIDEEYIEAAAICIDGTIYTANRPARHGCVMDRHPDMPFCQPEHQGFIARRGTHSRFVGRIEAKKIATKAGQLLERASPLPELFSEDVW